MFTGESTLRTILSSTAEANSLLQSLSLQGCHNIDSEYTKQLNADVWHIPDLTPPYTAIKSQVFGGNIEVDTNFK